MEDVGKALIMAAQLLMFVFAGSIAIYLYTTLTNGVNGIMLASDYSNRGDAIVGNFGDFDTTRTVHKEEIIMAILDLKNKYDKTGDLSYYVKVGTTIYKYDLENDAISVNNSAKLAFNSVELRANLNGISNLDYKLSYDESGKALIYTQK